MNVALRYEATTFASTVFINEGGRFAQKPLPNYAQISSINDLQILDYNSDGNPDILAGGNLYTSEAETPRNDASKGVLLLGDGTGEFEPLMPISSGIDITGEIRQIEPILLDSGRPAWIVARNNDGLVYVIREEEGISSVAIK